ncbi:hypothetical protein Q9966_008929 [Columba livia]|nr:hypothetical protein Q9966_008929 [Columba livia]
MRCGGSRAAGSRSRSGSARPSAERCGGPGGTGERALRCLRPRGAAAEPAVRAPALPPARDAAACAARSAERGRPEIFRRSCRRLAGKLERWEAVAARPVRLLARDLLEGTQAMRRVRKSRQVRAPNASVHPNPTAAKTLRFKCTQSKAWRLQDVPRERGQAPRCGTFLLAGCKSFCSKLETARFQLRSKSGGFTRDFQAFYSASLEKGN